MAPGKTAVDFNAIINTDRQRRKNEALANEIFSKNRRQSAPAAGASRKPGSGPSLASRVGVAKRTLSTTQQNAKTRSNLRVAANPSSTKLAAGNVDAEWTHDLHGLNNPTEAKASQSVPGPRKSHVTRTEQLYEAFRNPASSPVVTNQFNVVRAVKASKSSISIKGLAGPYIVMAKNFAQGTTADDIESAMTPVGGVCLSCRIITEKPSVIAEIIFESREGADHVVSTFNNQNADGNVLHVSYKVGPATKLSAPKLSSVASARSTTPLGPRADTERRRREYHYRDEVMDGSYGFEDRMDTNDNVGGPLYSDGLVDRGHGSTRDRINERGRGFR